jgi:hypothetical protein
MVYLVILLLATVFTLLPNLVPGASTRGIGELTSSRIDMNKVKKKTDSLPPRLTEVEQDLLSHIQGGYQLGTDSLSGKPIYGV